MEDEYYEECRYNSIWKWALFIGLILFVGGTLLLSKMNLDRPSPGLLPVLSIIVGISIFITGIIEYIASRQERMDNTVPLKPILFQVKDICGIKRIDYRISRSIRTYTGDWLLIAPDIKLENGKHYKGMLKTYPNLKERSRIVRVEEI